MNTIVKNIRDTGYACVECFKLGVRMPTCDIELCIKHFYEYILLLKRVGKKFGIAPRLFNTVIIPYILTACDVAKNAYVKVWFRGRRTWYDG